MTVVYHVCKLEDEGDFSKGYIGVTDNFQQRMDSHFSGASGSERLWRAICKYGELSTAILYSGPREQMLCVEEYLRPHKRIGWNIAAGGGNPPSAKGKSMSQEQKDKIGASNSIRKSTGTWVVKGQEFHSCSKAAEVTGHTKKSIIKWCKLGYNGCSFIPK